jgi:recombination protein RecR
MEYPSKLIEIAVQEIAKLPGIGKKSALRIVLGLLKKDIKNSQELGNAIITMRENIKYCNQCYNVSDQTICSICTSIKRDDTILCVVEDLPDVLAIENTGQYFGKYHVLGGILSPIQGIGPSELKINELIERIKITPSVKEIILALSPTMEGDTTAHYISKRLQEFTLKISSIARGIPLGGELEYTDEITLGRSIVSRIKYE